MDAIRMHATAARSGASVGVVAALLMAACAGPQATSGPPAPPSPAFDSGAFVPGDGDRAGLVRLGDGREMYLECRGTGAQVVVFISGAGAAADNWSYSGSATDEADPAEPSASAVLPATAGFATACAYDRPGTQQVDGAPSRSTVVPQPTTAQDDATDLHALLAAAEIAPPYVLVAHSWGGFVGTVFARTHPDDVSGLVLLDPGSQYLRDALPVEVWARWLQDIAAAGGQRPDGETPDYPASIAALEASAAPFPDIPVVVMSADQPFDYLGRGDARTYWPNWLDAATLLSDSLGATHITETNSGHFVGIENPTLVVDHICEMVPGC